MPWGQKPSVSLQAELAKMAKLSAMESGLPILIRGAPVAAVLAGELFAKATDGRNRIEERLLGDNNVVMLGESRAHSTGRMAVQSNSHGHTGPQSHGARLLCMLCSGNKFVSLPRGTEDLQGSLPVFLGAVPIRQPLSAYGIFNHDSRLMRVERRVAKRSGAKIGREGP
ncbi:hypothetical protein LLEC1_06861 [Akanthomyces lecanii]|uniref:Uncharacterized protein n=1 Tax=Cordyceps confragosa TaxID=2714763 RepID=A0A179IGT7_CORDF|nr:hypothetical protein LLEC1_06861 [Akanthomyces lecanii]